MKLGQLKAGAGAQVKLTYIMELPVEDKATRLTIPTTIAPRYIPPTDNSSAAKEIAKIGYKSSFDPKTPLHIQIKTIMKGKIKSITSPTHDLDVEIDVNPDDNGQFNANAKLKEATTDVMNRDLVVLFKVEDNDKPTVFVEKNEESLAAMVSLIPSFKLEEQKTEIIFLVDRSGSMMGESINMAKKALKIFLHSLPVNCYFNIVSFGSRFSYLFERGSAIYDDHSLEKAKAHVEKMEANYGGTEVYAPLKSIFSQSSIQGYARQIFLLTDGAVSNDDQVIKHVRSNNKSSRVFTLGLGSSASRHLVKGVARAGNGTSIFSNLNEDLRQKVVTLLKNALMPALTDLKVLWNGIHKNLETKESEEKPKEQVRTLLGYNKPTSEDEQTVSDGNQSEVLFDGARMLNFKLFAKDETLEKVVIVAQAPDGPLSVTIPITAKDHLKGGNFVHQMASRRRIQEIEDSLPFDEYDLPEHAKKEITDLGLKFGLATKYTSFIGVDKQSKKSLFEGAMESRHIEHEIPHMMCGPPMAMACMMAAPPPPPMCNSMGPMRRSLKKCTEKASNVEFLIQDSFAFDEDEDMNCTLECDSAPPEEIKENVDGMKPVLEPGLNEIIDLQLANGSFKMDKVLEKLLSMDEETLKKKCPSSAEFVVWITALCVAWIETKYSKEKDLWILVTTKGRKYLANASEELDVLLNKANDVVNLV